ncbi:YSIRK-type signal peptide-containing protein [Streptococcus salivarius]|nr:YSIRK-type signal peptide-containing protein [Streptococcus salivarius]
MISCLGGYMGKDIFSKKSRFSIRKLNIGVCSVLLGTLIMIGHTAQADETTSDGATVAATAVSASQGDGASTTTPPITAPESASTTTVAPAATEAVPTSSVAPTTTVDSGVGVSSEAPVATSTTSSAPASSEASSTSPVASSEATTSTSAKPTAASEVSNSVTASTATTTASSESATETTTTVLETVATPRVRRRRSTEGTTRSVDETNLQRAVVTKENFESFFQEGGTATYDKSTGTIKLTDDVSGQVGSAYLRFKIDSGEPFTFTGKVDIGNKYEGKTDADGRPGGDGVGFVFHTGKVDTIGQSGASIGMGTIKNAFGFKLDSWHNTSNPNANQNASADPKYGNGRKVNGKFVWEQNAFGSFYSSNAAGKVTTSSTAAAALDPKPNGEWVDFKIVYDKDKNFTVTYGSQTWTTNLKNANTSIMTAEAKRALTNGNPTFALSFLGSTGSGTNLQRVQIERFEFTAPQIVHMKFVDVNGNEIEASSAIPGDENEVVNLSTQDKKIAAVEAKGYKLKKIDHSKAPSYNEDNNTVTLSPGGQLLTYVFEEKDTTPPDAPVVNPVTAGATAVTGTAEAGSTVEVTLPDGSKATATADPDGNFSVPVSALKENDTVSVTAKDASNNTSTPTTVTVPDTTAPVAPTVNPVTAGATAVTGTAEAGSTVEVTLPDGSKATATADPDGNFSVPVSALKENDTVSVTAKDASNNTSAPTTATVAKADDKTAPDAPVVNPVKAGDTAVTGTAEAGSTVEVTLPDGTKATATADQDGNFSVPVSGLEEGQTVSVTAKDASNNTSAPTTATVAKADDKTAPDAPVVNPVKAGDTAVTGTAEAGSTVEVTLPDGTKATATADQDGNFSVPVSGLEEGQTVSVTAKDASNNTSAPTTATVAKADDKTAPDAPVVNTDLTGKAGTRTPIDVIAEPGAKIELFDKDGNKIGEATADEMGHAIVVPTVNIPEGNVTAKATDLSGNVSDASAPMLATRGGSTDTFNNAKGSVVAQTTVKPSPVVDVQAVDSSDKHMNLKATATISAAQKDTSTLPATGEEASTAAVVLGGVLAAFGLTLAGKRKKED